MEDRYDSRPIGVFDSGVGGLTVLDAIRRALPCEDFVYLGDTARVPYGNRTPQTIVRYAVSCAQQLVARDVKAIVIACNTASAHALDALNATFDVPVFGVIEPASHKAVRVTRTGHVGIIGTRATI
ncbi:MAG: glutamate racemase [Proteobacteria bacterium]|nr:glutamate racemase [Pseudomonadota bacterium]